jgi:ketosteroid isomerase-like protein
MDILFENPLRIIFIGIVIEAVLGIVLFRTGRGALLWAMLGVLALTLLGVVIERLVVTERERVEMTLDGITAALEANDLKRVLSYVAPEAVQTRNRAAWALGRIEVQSAWIYRLEITVNRLTSPMTAKAAFFGHISYRDRQGESPYNNYGSRFVADLRKQGDIWVVTGHVEEQEAEGKNRVINTE